MKFREHETVFEAVKKELGKRSPFRDWRQFYAHELNRLKRPWRLSDHGNRWVMNDFRDQAEACCRVENWWYEAMRPYYKVWPSITDTLLKFNLNIRHGDVHLSPRIFAIRFQEGNELRIGKCACWSILTTIARQPHINGSYFEMLVVFPIVYRESNRIWDGMHFWGTLVNSSPEGNHSEATIEEGLDQFSESISDEYEEEPRLRKTITKIALMIHLMADDPSVVKPEVLADDKKRFDHCSDEDLRQRLINKAKKRGIVGWRVGEEYESIPHYRRPHPALYHVGKGRKEQRIVFRSGCVVHRDKMTKVPTGYITPEGVEVEP